MHMLASRAVLDLHMLGISPFHLAAVRGRPVVRSSWRAKRGNVVFRCIYYDFKEHCNEEG